MVERPARLFYRIVSTDPPTCRDFMSYEALGVPPRRPLSPTDRDRWRGVSHYATRAAAEAAARSAPRLGTLLAAVQLPPDAAVRVEQTGRDPDHFTIWAEAVALLGWVVSVTRVERVH